MKFDLIIFTTVTLSSDVVGVFRRNESVAVRGRVRAGGVGIKKDAKRTLVERPKTGRVAYEFSH